MIHSVEWADDTGFASLSNLKGIGGSRFGNWTPERKPIGPAAIGLGTGRLHRFEFRRDDLFTMEIAAIPESELELMLRLQYHLLNGGVISLTTDRPLSDTFIAYALAPETEPTIDFSDRQMLEYTFAVKLKGLSEGDVDAGDDLPTSEPTLIFWAKASFETAYEDQEDVNRAWDFSGNTNHADNLQAISFQPKFVTNVTNNGGPAFQFTASNNGNFGGDADTDPSSGEPEYLRTPILATPTDGMTVFIVAKRHGLHIEHTNFYRLASTTDAHANALKENDPQGLRWNEGDIVIPGAYSTEWFIHAVRFESQTLAEQFYNNPLPEATSWNPGANADFPVCIIMAGGGQLQIAEMQAFAGHLNHEKMVRRFAYLASQHDIVVGQRVVVSTGTVTVTGFAPTVS